VNKVKQNFNSPHIYLNVNTIIRKKLRNELTICTKTKTKAKKLLLVVVVLGIGNGGAGHYDQILISDDDG
jgi:hypothetical protein